METLESKIGKPDWKQWLPVYGHFKLRKDEAAGKPVAIDNYMDLYSIYQSTSFIIGSYFVMLGIDRLISKLSPEIYEKLKILGQ